MEILPRLHRIPKVTANVYALIAPEGITLIDAGLPRSAGKILRYLEEIGESPERVRNVLITHADADHYGGLHALLEACPQAQVYASAIEAEAIRAGKQSRPLKVGVAGRLLFRLVNALYPLHPATVHRTLRDGDALPILGGILVLETPGHTPGHLSYFLAEGGILFGGDSVRVSRGSVVISQGMNTWDEAQAQKSVEKQAKLHPRLLCAGHGEVLHDAASNLEAALTQVANQDTNR